MAKELKGGKWERYKVSGESLERLNRSCPKCGGGVFLAKHKDRLSCGSCGYSEKTQKQ